MHPILAALRKAAGETIRVTNPTREEWLGKLIERAQELLDTAGAEHFDEFWRLYPNKVAKDVARKAWVRMDGDQYFEAIMKNVQWRLRSNEWNPLDFDRRRFIPHASTYLNQRRWLDPMTVERSAGPRDF